MFPNDRWRVGHMNDAVSYRWHGERVLDTLPSETTGDAESDAQRMAWHDTLLVSAVLGGPVLVGLLVGTAAVMLW